MTKALYILLFLPVYVVGQWGDPYEDIDSDQLQRLYKATLNTIEKEKVQLRKDVTDIQTSSAVMDSAFTSWLCDNIWPFWLGTTWDFNGYTSKPRDGVIACGYFVSTTLQHVGVNVDRYKLAQQYSLNIVEILCGKESTVTYQDASSCVSAIHSDDDGVWVVGLSNHVGFLLKRNGKVWFAHSSYVEPAIVTIELASESAAFGYSTTFVVGPLTGNIEFLEKWLNGTRIKV